MSEKLIASFGAWSFGVGLAKGFLIHGICIPEDQISRVGGLREGNDGWEKSISSIAIFTRINKASTYQAHCSIILLTKNLKYFCTVYFCV